MSSSDQLEPGRSRPRSAPSCSPARAGLLLGHGPEGGRQGARNAEGEQYAVATLQEFADLLQKLHTLPKPTIAALNGDALAGGRPDGRLRLRGRGRGGPDRLSRGPPRAGRRDRHARPDPAGRRPACAATAPGGDLITASRPIIGGWSTRSPRRIVPRRGDPAGQEHVESAPQAIAATKRLLDEAQGRPRPPRCRRRQRGGPRLRGGPGGHPRLPRKAAAALGARRIRE